MPPKERQEPGLLSAAGLLLESPIQVIGLLPYSSNHTFLVRLDGLTELGGRFLRADLLTLENFHGPLRQGLDLDLFDKHRQSAIAVARLNVEGPVPRPPDRADGQGLDRVELDVLCHLRLI